MYIIDVLSRRADDSELISLLASSRRERLDNVELTRELRDVVGVLKCKLHQREMSVLRHRTEIRVESPETDLRMAIPEPLVKSGG
jgi:hypothetical protein